MKVCYYFRTKSLQIPALVQISCHLCSLFISLPLSEMAPVISMLFPTFHGKIRDGDTGCVLSTYKQHFSKEQIKGVADVPALFRKVQEAQTGKKDGYGSLATKTLAPGYAASLKPKSENCNG